MSKSASKRKRDKMTHPPMTPSMVRSRAERALAMVCGGAVKITGKPER